MSNWISIDERVPELTETVRIGHVIDEYNLALHPGKGFSNLGDFIVDGTFRQSKEVVVAEQKGDGFEEDVGVLMRSGWASNCDNVTHWKDK